MMRDTIHTRDLRTPLGEALSATEDLKAVIELRLEAATLDLSNAQQGYDYQRGVMDEVEQTLESARTKRAYWWAQKAKLEGQIEQEPYTEPEPAQKDVYPELDDADAPEEPEWRKDEYVMASVHGSDRQIMKRRYDADTYDTLYGRGDHHWTDLRDVARLVEVKVEGERR